MGIEIKQLRKSFGDKEILKGIDFSFEQGKINMIIGASGSGKSVMLKCIVGLMKPSNGQVLYDGLDFHNAGHKDVRNLRTNMGMLFQYSALFDYMTVEENVAFPLKLFTKWTQKAIAKRVEFCLERVTMAGTNKLYPAELSGGMMKRVGIARAIAMNPQYLFVDEPNSGLDPLTASVIDELIQEITYEFNMCTVVVSHDMNSVLNISDKILYLYNGLKEWTGTKREILRSGNPNLDKFVFVSDLIRRDVYDEEAVVETPAVVIPPSVEPESSPEQEEKPEMTTVVFGKKREETEKPPEAITEVALEDSASELEPRLEDAVESISEVTLEDSTTEIESRVEDVVESISEEPIEEVLQPEEIVPETLSIASASPTEEEESLEVLDSSIPLVENTSVEPLEKAPLSRAEAEAKLKARLDEIAAQSQAPIISSTEELPTPTEETAKSKDKSSKKKKKKKKKDKGKA